MRRVLFYGLSAVFIFGGNYFWRCITIAGKNNSKENPINGDILALPGFSQSKTIRVIGADGEQLGLLQYSQAQHKADSEGYDLVMMSQQADPPVCRIMDYGKFRFERDKKEKESKKRQQIIDIKEIQLSCHIDVNDFNTKVNHAIRFLKNGDKVKLRVQFRGRQMTRLEVGHELVAKFAKACEEYGSIEKAAAMEGRNMIVFISPLKLSGKGKTGGSKGAGDKGAGDKAVEGKAEGSKTAEGKAAGDKTAAGKASAGSNAADAKAPAESKAPKAE